MRRKGLTIFGIAVAMSLLVHVGILTWSVLTYGSKPFEVATADSMPIDLISDSDFTKMRTGLPTVSPDAQKVLAEKVDTPKPVEDPARKVDDKKPEITATAAPPPTPTPQPRPETKSDELKKQPEQKIDPIAEQIKKEQAKKVEPKKEVAKKQPVPQPQQRFDADNIQALLDKRDPRRQMASADQINQRPRLGIPDPQQDSADGLAVGLLEPLKRRVMPLWNPPATQHPEQLVVTLRVRLNRDGTLAGPIVNLTTRSDPLFKVASERAAVALVRGQPYDMLPPDKYDIWKDVEVTFDPREMFAN